MMARKLVSRVSSNAPLLPNKQAHALSPLGANFHHPFFCSNGYGFSPKRVWEQNIVKFGFGVTFLYPCMGTTAFLAGNGTSPAPDADSGPHTLFLGA